MLKTRPGSPVVADMIRADLEMLYQRGKYASVVAEVYDDEADRHVRYRLRGNPVLKEIKITGATVASTDTLLSLMVSRIGAPIDFRTLRQDAVRIRSWYHDRDYDLTHLASFTADLETGRVEMVLDEGRIASVEVSGNVRTREWAILREFPLQSGDIFDAAAADRGITNIHSTGLFESITMDIEKKDGRPTVRIDVRERSSLIVKLGARFGRERDSEAVLSLTEANLLGTGSRVTGRMDYGSRRQRFSLDFRSDRVFRTYLTYRVSMYRQRDDRYVYNQLTQIGDFRETRNGIRFTLGQQIARLGTVSLTARVEGNTYRTRRGASPDGRSDIRSLRLRSQVDNLDRYPFPSSGHLHDAWIETASDVLGGHQRFLRGHASLEWYHTLNGRFTLRPQFVFGIGEGDIPFSEQFSLGGQQSFFGYRDDQFRGAYLLSGSFMVRTLIMPRVFADVRYDTGGLWQRRKDFRWDDLRHGVGIGLSLDTPVGPFQVHYGSASFGARRAYLNLGHRF
ncbi:MAG: BamA/TamA family outer membrane protein [Candidatus Latescibacteria bacterium]|nr:BamA/TamA family outer membrane protein [Candidatus Latescibacterota bacterium]